MEKARVKIIITSVKVQIEDFKWNGTNVEGSAEANSFNPY